MHKPTISAVLLAAFCVSEGCAPFDPNVDDAMDSSTFGGTNGVSTTGETGQTSIPEPGSTSAVDSTETGGASTTTAGMNLDSSAGEEELCGNGRLDEGEACDDGLNDGSYGGCEGDCQSPAPHCGDTIVNGPEACDDGNTDSTDGCLADCSVPASCMDILVHDPAAATGIYVIDSDGPAGLGPHDAHCDMDHAGGGWTMVLVSADDGIATWTWNNQDLMTTDTTLVGSLQLPNNDYKSAAYHELLFTDLLFIHQPSDAWASYDGVGDGTLDIGSFMWTIPYPQCDLDEGVEMTEGNITQIGTALCDTKLYFHPGDFDGNDDIGVCMDVANQYNGGTYGPAWNAANNGGCPMDDSTLHGLGPHSGLCQLCTENGYADQEFDGRGFALALDVDEDGDRIEMYVR